MRVGDNVDYQEIGQHIKIKLNAGEIDDEFLKSQNIAYPGPVDRQGAINTFNQVAVKNNLRPLRDPMGYMTQDNNVYDAIKQAYQDKYNSALDMAESGMAPGGGYGEEAILNNLNKVVRNDIKAFLPKDLKYSDLRFVQTTPETQKTIDKMASSRVKLTQMHTIKRSIEKASFMKTSLDFKEESQKLARSVAQEYGIKMPQPKLSKNRMLLNAKGDTNGLNNFIKHLQNPDKIELDNDGNAVAQFREEKKDNAKFIIANRKYLKDYNFTVKKAKGAIEVSYFSENTLKQYSERQSQTLSSALNDLNQGSSQTMQ